MPIEYHGQWGDNGYDSGSGRALTPGCRTEQDALLGFSNHSTQCGNVAPGSPGWYCTRPRQHRGDHVCRTASSGGRVQARWAPAAGRAQ
jgi:hypothetical protein